MSGFLRVYKEKPVFAERGAKSVDPVAGKTAFYVVDGVRVPCVVGKALCGDRVEIDLTLPDADGILHRVGSKIVAPLSDVKLAPDLVLSGVESKVKAWEASVTLAECKSPTPIYAGEEGKSPIVDYRNVTIEGFLSTFVGTTPADRDGDYVEPDAFKETMERFKRNPVMLIDHERSVRTIAGSFESIGTNQTGLTVRGKLSNAPGLIDVRFKVAEGHLRSLSMGGLFHYKEDGRGIFKVDLWEGSLVPVPANPDALFMVRSVTVVDAAKAIREFTKSAKFMRA